MENKMKSKKIIIGILLASCITGCSLTKEQTISQEKNEMIQKNYTFNTQWWKSYNDEQLNLLINTIIKENLDLVSATLKVQQALYQFNLTSTNKNPEWTASSNFSTSKNLKSGVERTNTLNINTNISYEIDLWNKFANQRNVKEWELVATEQDKEVTKNTLIGTGVSLYFKLGYLNKSIQVTKGSINYYEKILGFVKLKHELGNVGLIDELQAEQSLSTAKTQLITLEQQQKETENAIKVLVNKTPDYDLSLDYNKIQFNYTFNNLKADIPLEVIKNRPDMKAAEYRVKSAFSNIEATKASYYPALSLTSSLGYASSNLSNLLANPIGTLGAGISLPFLNFNEKKWNIKISENSYEQYIISFKQTLLTSLQEINNNINAYYNERIKIKELEDNNIVSQKIVAINKIRYESGNIDMQEFLESQENARQVELTLISSKYNLILNKNNVFQAIGGEVL